MRKPLYAFIILFLAGHLLFAADDLLIQPSDIRLSYDSGTGFGNASGYHLYIRKKPGMESVLLTETTKDPVGENDNYAYRAATYNIINGNEIRYLDGKPLISEGAKYSLIDSTPEVDSAFGQSFHIYIPSEIVYGYSWTRNGTIKIGRGTFINIRAFSKKYGDYTGIFFDNPYMFDLGILPPVSVPAAVKTPVPPPAPVEVAVLTDDYNPVAAEKFKDIAGFGGGEIVYSKGPETLVDDIMASIERINPKETVDVVFAIDATGSMKDDVAQLRKEWVPRLIASLKNFGQLRLALLLYRDYGDSFSYRGLPVKLFDFTDSTDRFTRDLNSFVIYGTEGGDIPEAVYEGLYSSMEFYPWRTDSQRKIILIGDAPPHPTPRGSGKYTKALIAEMAQGKHITIDTIIVPDDKAARGR
jgi:hypothetical protein